MLQCTGILRSVILFNTILYTPAVPLKQKSPWRNTAIHNSANNAIFLFHPHRHNYSLDIRGCLQFCTETSQRSKQGQTSKQCHKLHSAGPVKKRLKGRKCQPVKGSLDKGWMEDSYQLLKDSRGEGRRRTALRSPLIDIQQTVSFCLSYQRGLLPLGHTHRRTSLLCSVNSCKAPIATVCLFASVYAFICAHMHVSLTCFLCVC